MALGLLPCQGLGTNPWDMVVPIRVDWQDKSVNPMVPIVSRVRFLLLLPGRGVNLFSWCTGPEQPWMLEELYCHREIEGFPPQMSWHWVLMLCWSPGV